MKLKRCICNSRAYAVIDIHVQSLLWLIFIIGLIIWSAFAKEFVVLGIAIGLVLFASSVEYKTVRKKKHSVLCSLRQILLIVAQDLYVHDPIIEPDENNFPATMRIGKSINCAPAFVYFYRSATTGLFALCIGGLLGIPFLGDDEDITILSAVLTGFIAIAVSLIPGIVIVRQRPRLVIDKTGFDIVVSKFFRNRYATWAYAAIGYGNDTLAWTIDFAEPSSTEIANVKYFKISKRYFLYSLKAILPDRKSVLVCTRYSKKKIKLIKAELESLKA